MNDGDLIGITQGHIERVYILEAKISVLEGCYEEERKSFRAETIGKMEKIFSDMTELKKGVAVLENEAKLISKKLGGWNRVIETLLIGAFLATTTLVIKKIGG